MKKLRELTVEDTKLPNGIYRSKVVVPRNKFNKNEDQAALDGLKKLGKIPRNNPSGGTLVGMKVLDKNAVDVTLVVLYSTNRSAAIDLLAPNTRRKWTDADYKVESENKEMKTYKQLINEGAFDKEAAKELMIYLENDGQLYRSNLVPAIKNMERKYKRGSFDKKLGVKLFMYTVDAAAKKYNKEFGSAGDRVDSIFSKATREAVAKDLVDHYWNELELGNSWL